MMRKLTLGRFLYFWLICHKLIDHKRVYFWTLFYSIDLCASFHDNSVLFWLLGHFLSPSIMNVLILSGREFWVVFFSFKYFRHIMPLPSGLQSIYWKNKKKKKNKNLIVWWGFCCMWLVVLLLFAFKIISLSLIFVILIIIGIYLDTDILVFVLFGTFCASWVWISISFCKWGMFSPTILLNNFSSPLSLFYVGLIHVNVSMLDIVPEVP